MAIAATLTRITDYNRRHGFAATIRRLGLAIKRSVLAGRSVLFYCDLATQTSPTRDLPAFLKVERKSSFSELGVTELEAMTSVWNSTLVRQKMNERFDLGAVLWLIKFNGNLAGYGWTLQGRTVEPHFFPMGDKDVQFLDFHVFPKYRGRAIDWFLIVHILHQLAADGFSRAFGEAGEWNQPSISSFKMTPFRRLGVAKKWTIFRYTIVSWGRTEGLN